MAEAARGGARGSPDALVSLRSLTLPLYLPTFLQTFALGASLPVIPLAAVALGGAEGAASVVFAMRGLGTLAVDLPAGLLVARFGDKAATVVGACAMAAAGVAAAGAESPFALGLCIFGLGGGMALWGLARMAFVADVVSPGLRGRALALVGGVSRAGIFLGPVAGGAVAERYGLPAAFLLQAAAMGGAALLLALFVPGGRHRVADPAAASSPRELARAVGDRGRELATAGSVVVVLQMVRSARHLLLALWGHGLDLSVGQIGLVVGLSSAMDMVCFAPAGALMDRLGRKWAGVPSLGLMALAIALLPAAPGFGALVAVGLLAGAGNGLSSGLVMTLGTDLAPPERRGPFLGVWRVMADAGSSAGPLAVGAVAAAASLSLAAGAVAAVGALGAGAMAWLVADTRDRSPGSRDADAPRGEG